MNRKDQESISKLYNEMFDDRPSFEDVVRPAKSASKDEMGKMIDAALAKYEKKQKTASEITSGIETETEHADPETQSIIASIDKEKLEKIVDTVVDHLAENPEYYTKLQQANL